MERKRSKETIQSAEPQTLPEPLPEQASPLVPLMFCVFLPMVLLILYGVFAG